jgi:peptidoglycan hydrolase CwlO-like protein
MILLEAQDVTSGTWRIILEILTVIGLTGSGMAIFFNLNRKVDVMEERVTNFKTNVMQELSGMKVTITEIKDAADATKDKIDQKMQRLEDKIDRLPNDIATTFKTLLQVNKQ